jgi:hypothetical protein
MNVNQHGVKVELNHASLLHLGPVMGLEQANTSDAKSVHQVLHDRQTPPQLSYIWKLHPPFSPMNTGITLDPACLRKWMDLN